MHYPEKLDLAFLPTPIYPLKKLSAQYSKEIYIKRDDLTGIETSGNKIRKLEYSLAEALREGADLVITCGGIQSNHCRATAYAAARLSLKCCLLLRGNEAGEANEGNYFLDKLAGEQVDLFVNGQCIAKGDVVVVEDNFGVRITEIMKVNLTTLE